jgi:hypothetical protein
MPMLYTKGGQVNILFFSSFLTKGQCWLTFLETSKK